MYKFKIYYKGKYHYIEVYYIYGSNDDYYWDKEYYLIIDNKPYIFLVVGSISGWVSTCNSLKQTNFDYLKNRIRKNAEHYYNDITILDFLNDKNIFLKLYKFMLDNNAKEVCEKDNDRKEILE